MIIDDVKALYIIANVGFAEELVEVTRSAGAGGATIMNARGTSDIGRAFLGISSSPEKEIILTLAYSDVAERIMTEIRSRLGVDTPTGAVCFMMPVAKVSGITLAKDGEK